MEGKKSNDLFSYFRFEASGDSDDGFDIPNINNMDWEISTTSTRSLVYGDHDDDDNNEDAMSCSYEGSGVNEQHHSWCDSDDDDDDEKRSEDEGEEQDVVYGMSYCEEDDDDDEVHDQQHHHHQKKKKKLCVSNFDSGHDEPMDEMEKNRQFWEACLAS